MDGVERHALWLAAARAAFGLPPLAAPETCLRLLGRSRARAGDPGRFFAGFFGVRELLLAAFAAALRRDTERLKPVVALGALADVGDAGLLLRDVARGDGVDPVAAVLLSTAVAGSVASLAVWWQVARQRP